jgi:hypothetical protein
MSMKLGIDSKLYRNTGNYNTPTWTSIDAVRDFTQNVAYDTVEAPSRESRVKSMAKTLVDISGSGSVKVSDTDAGYIALWDALISSTTELDILVLNGDSTTNGARGFRYDAIVTQGNEDQAITNALYMDFEVHPSAFATNAMKSAVVAAGAPVFTSI